MEQDARKVVMVRFGEIFLKSEAVRREFLNRLRDNIRAALKASGIDGTITITRSRVLVSTESPVDLVPVLSHIFGIIDIAPVTMTPSDMDGLCDAAALLAKKHLSPSTRFAVRARREGVEGFSSQELGAEAGSRIIDAIPDLKVDLTNPEYEVFIEARKGGSMVYDTRTPGPGGLPYGTQGKAVSLISAGIDSPVAAWLMMKRGVRMVFLHIAPGRFGGTDISKNLTSNLQALSRWTPGIELRLVTVKAEPLFQALMDLSDQKLRCVVCKRAMLLLAAEYAKEAGCDGIITGDNLGQVATQTLHNLAPISAGIDVPIYRPLIGYDKEEIITLARKIGSFSSEPGDTSCHVLPSRPVTKSDAGQIDACMDELSMNSIIRDILSQATIIKIKNEEIQSG
ncbi:tRNA uracil 4-sulfurtransferase ThiI [Methanospirillum stamsii]|nr:tRNA uracil 4-sulfurtransferase ThiI [Methanospirillum stamsii]